MERYEELPRFRERSLPGERTRTAELLVEHEDRLPAAHLEDDQIEIADAARALRPQAATIARAHRYRATWAHGDSSSGFR
jgi:hypothetical protein